VPWKKIRKTEKKLRAHIRDLAGCSVIQASTTDIQENVSAMPARLSSHRPARACLSLLACAAALACTPILSLAAPAAIDLPAQPLSDAIKALARATGTSIAADSALLAGKTAPAVRGHFEPAEALQRLLAGSGLEAAAQPQGGWLLRAAPARPHSTLQEVQVTAAALRDGRTEGTQAYVAPYASAATKIELTARETPQSVSVLTRTQLDNQNFVELTEAAKVVPGVIVRRQSSAGGRSDILSRGYQSSTYQLDGLTVSGNPATQETLDLALFDRRCGCCGVILSIHCRGWGVRCRRIGEAV
jgi:outer membrane receptor for ferric coprogen and ferric-rhodotorulic acid